MLIYQIPDKDYGSITSLNTFPLSDYESDKAVMQQWEEARTEVRNLPNCQGIPAILLLCIR